MNKLILTLAISGVILGGASLGAQAMDKRFLEERLEKGETFCLLGTNQWVKFKEGKEEREGKEGKEGGTYERSNGEKGHWTATNVSLTYTHGKFVKTMRAWIEGSGFTEQVPGSPTWFRMPRCDPK